MAILMVFIQIGFLMISLFFQLLGVAWQALKLYWQLAKAGLGWLIAGYFYAYVVCGGAKDRTYVNCMIFAWGGTALQLYIRYMLKKRREKIENEKMIQEFYEKAEAQQNERIQYGNQVQYEYVRPEEFNTFRDTNA